MYTLYVSYAHNAYINRVLAGSSKIEAASVVRAGAQWGITPNLPTNIVPTNIA